MKATTETQVRVRYAETDQMGVVYHANYLVWFEVGRVEHLRQNGINYSDMEADNCIVAVVEARCRYKAPARYDDIITIRTRVTSQRGPIIRFEYEALRAGDGVLLAEGETVHVCIDREFQACPLPDKYRLPLAEAGLGPRAPSPAERKRVAGRSPVKSRARQMEGE